MKTFKDQLAAEQRELKVKDMLNIMQSISKVNKGKTLKELKNYK